MVAIKEVNARGEEVSAPEGRPESEIQAEAQARKLSTIDKMREHFAAQPKERIKIRKDASGGHTQVSVQVNGYTFLIQTDATVDVPTQVADMLREADYI